MENNEKKKNVFKAGLYVFILLAVLTVAEYAIAVAGVPGWSIFMGIALVKAWFVVQKYMHLPRLFAEESVNHDS